MLVPDQIIKLDGWRHLMVYNGYVKARRGGMILVKKFSLALLIILSSLLLTSIAYASPKVTLDGKQLTFDVPPVIDSGRTLVPLRAIFEALGATVQWNANNQTIVATKGDTSIQLTVGKTSATKNGVQIALDVPPKIIDGRTLVPLRFIGEALGCQVNWDESTQTVSISDTASGSTTSQPASSSPAPAVVGQWEPDTWSDGLGQAWNIPGEPNIGVLTTNMVDPGNGNLNYIYGKPITIQLYLSNSSSYGGPAESITILNYTPNIEIDSYDSSNNKTVIWKQAMPTLSGTLAKPDDYYSIKVNWNQLDMAGNQVAPGDYTVWLQPGVLTYKTPDGTEHQQTLDGASGTLTMRNITIAQP
jgi:hypothetical protein